MMSDEILLFESSINLWAKLMGMGSLEDHKGFEALRPQFWRLDPPLQ